MFDFSATQIGVVLLSAYFLLTPRDAPKVAYKIGKGLGQATGFMARSRVLVADVVKQASSFEKFKSEKFVQDIQKFQNIQHEIMGASMNPMQTLKYAVTSELTKKKDGTVVVEETVSVKDEGGPEVSGSFKFKNGIEISSDAAKSPVFEEAKKFIEKEESVNSEEILKSSDNNPKLDIREEFLSSLYEKNGLARK